MIMFYGGAYFSIKYKVLYRKSSFAVRNYLGKLLKATCEFTKLRCEYTSVSLNLWVQVPRKLF